MRGLNVQRYISLENFLTSCKDWTFDLKAMSDAVTLKPDCFEGLRFEFSKPFNQNFAFTHRWVPSLRHTPSSDSICWYFGSCLFACTISIYSREVKIDASVCSVYMGNMDVPTQNNQPIKMPMGTYEFGANLANSTVSPEKSLENAVSSKTCFGIDYL